MADGKGKAAGGNNSDTGGGHVGQDADELLRKLQAAEKRAEEAEQLLRDSAAAGAAFKVRHDDVPLAGDDGGYMFSVGPMQADKYPHLPSVEVRAVDESEAKRWYIVTHEDPPDSGRRVDPNKVKLLVKCCDPRRAEVTRLKLRLAAIRQKLASGASLSNEDQELLERHEADVMKF